MRQSSSSIVIGLLIVLGGHSQDVAGLAVDIRLAEVLTRSIPRGKPAGACREVTIFSELLAETNQDGFAQEERVDGRISCHFSRSVSVRSARG